MNICEQWFSAPICHCFDSCVQTNPTDKQTIALLRDELHETIVELKCAMKRLEQVTDELKESAKDVDVFRNQIRSLTEENEKLHERIKKLEGTFYSTASLEITIPRLKLRSP